MVWTPDFVEIESSWSLRTLAALPLTFARTLEMAPFVVKVIARPVVSPTRAVTVRLAGLKVARAATAAGCNRPIGCPEAGTDGVLGAGLPAGVVTGATTGSAAAGPAGAATAINASTHKRAVATLFTAGRPLHPQEIGDTRRPPPKCAAQNQSADFSEWALGALRV